MPSKKAKSRKPLGPVATGELFELEVELLSGPMTESFVKRNGAIARTIHIRRDQTLAVLHKAIFKAFDRFDEHMYEFQVGGKGPMDPKARRYVLPSPMSDPFDDLQTAGAVTRTKIGSLDLRIDEVFGYWFDFGDDWWHQIIVSAVHDTAPPGRYPKIVKRTGESPPQYVDSDEEE